MYIEQYRRDWIGNELCQWLGWGRAWHLAMESCCGGKRTFNEEPTDHWPLTTASVHRLQADTARAGTHFCQPLADRTVPSSIECWNWQNSKVERRYAFCLIYLCQFEPRYWVKVPCPSVPSISAPYLANITRLVAGPPPPSGDHRRSMLPREAGGKGENIFVPTNIFYHERVWPNKCFVFINYSNTQ